MTVDPAHDETKEPTTRRQGAWSGLVTLVVLLVGAAALWRFTPLSRLVDLHRLAALGAAVREHPAAPALVLVTFVAGALTLFPITFLLAGTALVFPPLRAIAFGLPSALVAAALCYVIGVWVGRHRPEWVEGRRFAPLRAKLRRRGVLTMATMRIVPAGNFSLMNMAAGAIGIPFRDFIVGNGLGMLPVLIVLTFFAGRLRGWTS
jgi:phospholipase D1/2